ncbi:g13409 [Coccomyxa viridis]|uniref:G13409 protein n=1 Tax=Coccomyxa viridis TaxID=1274662 RepID=A0ABP1GJV2_9CHLO
MARGPLLLTSRIAPTLRRSGLRHSFGAKAFASGRKGSRSIIRAAAEPEVEDSETETDTGPILQNEDAEGEWVPVCKPEEVPKGFRFEARAAGVDILLLWYRNQMYAIEQRSPAAGAYSEGFVNSKLTQNYEIECPDTKTKFSLKTGDITDWYPTNPVLRAITPKDTVRSMDIFPVKITQEAILVDVSEAATTKFQGAGRGGSDTSIDANNVFALQPRQYLEGSGPDDIMEMGGGAPAKKVDPYVLAISIFAYACLAVAGTAVCLYAESYAALGIFWVVLLAITGAYVLNYIKEEENAAN